MSLQLLKLKSLQLHVSFPPSVMICDSVWQGRSLPFDLHPEPRQALGLPGPSLTSREAVPGPRESPSRKQGRGSQSEVPWPSSLWETRQKHSSSPQTPSVRDRGRGPGIRVFTILRVIPIHAAARDAPVKRQSVWEKGPPAGAKKIPSIFKKSNVITPPPIITIMIIECILYL